MEQQPNEASNDIRVTMGDDYFDHMQGTAQEAYGKGMADLSFDEALFIVSSYFTGAAKNLESGLVKGENDGALLDSRKDGQEAFENYVNNMTERFMPEPGEECELILQIIRKPTMWEMIRTFSMRPRLVQTLRYHGQSSE